MITHFPSPVLSVAADAVKDLDGEDALYGLWALFTKCKESLKDGRRLENISWRLWYREIAASQHSPSSSPGTRTPASSERSSPPITPISEDGGVTQEPASEALLAPVAGFPAAHSWHGEKPSTLAFAAGRRLSTASVPMAARSHGAMHVGKLILEILPGKMPVAAVKAHAGAATLLPTVRLPNTPSPAGAAFPRVVVVNPTPNPTPPATPHVTHAAAAVLAALPTQPSLHLLPPPPARLLTTMPAPAQANKPAVSQQPIPSMSRDAQLSQPEPRDDTLKASDRRFFLQESPERGSPESSSRTMAGKLADGHELSPGSVSSNQTRSDAGAGHGAASGSANKRGVTGRAQGRKSKEVIRHAPARPGAHRNHILAHQQHHQPHQPRQPAQRKAASETKKTTFNIGSVSSNGSRAGEARPSRAAAAQKAPLVPRPGGSPPKQANGVGQSPRRGSDYTASSDLETTDTEDDSGWASEDNSVDEREKERQREETRLRAAAEEAQRQRDMFAKVPKRSYSHLNRSQSGLLSQLLNPDPKIFPPNHPYRTSHSTQDMTQFARQAGHAPPTLPLPTSKSSVAVPLAAQVTAQAPSHDRSAGDSNAYRLKGRPQGEELEDESDSGDENADDGIQVSRSLAQQKLAALADPNRRHHSERSLATQPAPRPAIPTVATAPIPLGHPYNLPAPAPVMTPRAIRRQMLSTELSESLRRNLLWERQVSKMNLTNRARRGGSVLGGGLRPLTAVNGESSTSSSDRNPSRSGNEGDEKEERNRSALARNRSWAADDYHYAGW